MGGINFEENDCPCLRCLYLTQATKVNEENDGSYNLKINCSIAGCPEGFVKKKAPAKSSEAIVKLSNCIEMLKRCIDLKSDGGKNSE